MTLFHVLDILTVVILLENNIIEKDFVMITQIIVEICANSFFTNKLTHNHIASSAVLPIVYGERYWPISLSYQIW